MLSVIVVPERNQLFSAAVADESATVDASQPRKGEVSVGKRSKALDRAASRIENFAHMLVPTIRRCQSFRPVHAKANRQQFDDAGFVEQDIERLSGASRATERPCQKCPKCTNGDCDSRGTDRHFFFVGGGGGGGGMGFDGGGGG